MWRTVALMTAVVVVVTACSGGDSSDDSAASDPVEVPPGQFEIDGRAGRVTDADCAQLSDGLVAAGTIDLDGEILLFELTPLAGTHAVAIRTTDADRPSTRYVTGEAEVTRSDPDGQESGATMAVEVTATYTLFDGPTQAGEADGALTFDCPADTDPGGGYLALDGQQANYDVVICTDREGQFEARARSTVGSEAQVLSISRTASLDAWIDRLESTGALAISDTLTVESTAGRAADVTGGRFEVDGDRVTLEGVIGEEGVSYASLDLTCGLTIPLD